VSVRRETLHKQHSFQFLTEYGAGASWCVSVNFPTVRSVANYRPASWRQRRIGVNNLPTVITQRYPAKTRIRDLLVTDLMLYYRASHHFHAARCTRTWTTDTGIDWEFEFYEFKNCWNSRILTNFKNKICSVSLDIIYELHHAEKCTQN